MPILNEKDALLVRDTFDLLSDEEKPRASEWMQKYEAQQNDLGEPLFPSQVQAMSQNREAVRKMFDGVDKVQAEISPWSENPNQDRAIHANMALLSDRYGKKPQEIADRYEFYLNDYAAQKFGMTQGVDDLTFYAAAAKQIQREKQKEDTEAEGQKAALRGDDVIPALQAWQAKNLDRMPDSTEFARGFLQAREAIAGIGVSDAVDAYQRAMQGAPKDGDAETLKDFEALLLDLPGAKRKAVLTAAAMMAQAKGENSVKGVGAREFGPMGGAGAAINAITGFFQEIGESGGRFAGKLGGIAKDEELEVMVNLPTLPLITDAAKAQHPLATGVAYTSLEKIDSAEKAAEFIKEWKVTSFGTASAGVTRADIDEANQTAKQYRELGADEKKLIEAAQKRELKKNQIARELRSIAESSDPVGEISGAIGNSVAMAAANILTRGKTLPISWQLYSEANYDQLRLENPSLEHSEARSISRVSGAGEAALDAFEIGILRKLPSVAAVFKSGTSAAWRNAGGRLGATFAFEQVQEGVQDLTLPFTRAVFEAVGIDTGLDMGAEWERWKDSRGTVAIASIPLILLGAGIATHRDIKDAQNLLSSRDRLGEQGIIEVEAVPILEAARAGKMDEAQALYREAFKRRSSEVAAEYQDKLDTQQKAVAEAVVEVTRQGLIPDYTLLPGGKVIVTDLSDGSKATFDSWRDAQPVIEQNMNEMERINNDSILRIADDILQKKGEEVTVSSRPSESLATRVRGGSMSPEDAIKAAIAANVIQGVNIDDARKIAADVFGESQEERIKIMRDAVERAIILGSNVVEGGVSKSKLFKGANLATLIEETSEGRLKEGLRLGRYKKSDWLGLIQQAEEATGEKFLIGSTSDAVNASPDFAPRALVEAVSRIVVADVLGRLQDGRRIGSGSITKSLEENNSPLVAWLRAFKRLLASVLRTAKRIREARKAGKLGDEYDAYIDDLLGVDQQAAFEGEAAAETEAIANEALNAGGVSYSEENPGPNGETFSMSRATPADVSQQTVMPDGARLVGPTTFSIRAYHGTPHKVYRFRLANIGTGEGAQAYGWGLYFAQSFTVADDYRGKLQKEFRIGFNGKTLIELYPNNDEAAKLQSRLESVAGNTQYGSQGESVRKAFLGATYGDLLSKAPPNPSVVFARQVEKDYGNFIKTETGGNLYTVELLPDEADFISWDDPISKQSSVFESGPNRIPRSIQFLANLSEGKALTPQYLSSLDVPRYADMLSSMFSAAQYFKIDGPIVGLIPVDVVDFLRLQKLTPQDLLHNKAMLTELLTATAPNVDVAVWVNESSVAASAKAKQIAEKLGASSLAGLSEKLIAANKAGAFNLHSDTLARLGQSATGKEFHDEIVKQLGSKKAASEYLASLGIPGIRYLDGGSRGAGEGTSNYVIFDENLVKILEENGKPVETFSLRSVSPSQDAEYMTAVEAGDMETAQRMVDAAAKAAGIQKSRRAMTLTSSIPWEDLSKFDTERARILENMAQSYWDATDDKSVYSNDRDEYLSVEFGRALVTAGGDQYEIEVTDAFTGGKADQIYEIHNGERVQLDTNFGPLGGKVPVDPVTYDEAGNVIPLSQRFNPADDRMTFSIAPKLLSVKPPKGVVANTTEALPSWTLPKIDGSVPKVLKSPKVRAEFYGKLDKAIEWLRADPSQITTAKGWVTFMRKAGVWGEIPMPPSGLADIITNPAAYVAKLNGGYHGAASLSDTQTSAKQGMDGTVEMRKLIGDGKAPAPFVVALHNMWGILSRMLSPIDQEGMWLRLIAHRPVLEAIQSSIDGNFAMTVNQWKQVVKDARAANAVESGPIGNAATSNANDFYLMLARLNGRWNDMANVYAAPNSREMGRRFWNIGEGKLGIKNKVQRFIGLTFGTPGVIMDRWKFVEFWLPTSMEGMKADQPSSYFDYSANTPSDPVGVYGTYGKIDSDNEALSLAMYEAFEVVLEESIAKSEELQSHLGEHANAGGMHWFGWNAIKNEAVGHSSLDLTKELVSTFGLEIDAEKVHTTVTNGTYYTEGSPSAGNTVKFILERGKVRVERTSLAGGLQPGRGRRNARGAGRGTTAGGAGTAEPVGSTFSLRSGDFASRMSAAFSPFQRNPELRLAIAQVAKARAMKLGAEWIEKASVIRSAGDIGKEARMREALAYETRMNDYLDGLTPNARQTLEFEPSALEDDPLVSAMLDYGKLMSFTNAKKAGKVDAKAGDYDGVPWLPSSFYSKGAGIMPDQMAQAMNDAGLLPDAYADTLWNELGKRIAFTKKNKAAHREAVAAYKAAQKYAKDASRAEADQWAEGAKKKAGSPKTQRDMLKAALRTLDGILAAAPPEVRAKVGGYVKLAGLATDEAMLQEIERRIEKLNVELEKYLKKEGIEQIEKLFKKARPDSEAGKKDKGKNADMHALFAAAERAAKMDEVAVAGELARLDSLIGGDTLTADQEALAITERGIVELVGDLKHADAGRVFSALDTLRDIYEGGWIKWKLAQIEKREERAGMRAAFIADTGKTGIKPERDAAEREAETLLGKIKGGFLSLSSFHEVLSYAFGSNSARVKSLVDAEREAAGQYEDVNQALADEVQDLFTGLAGGKVLAGEKLRFDMAQRTIQTVKGELSQLGAIQALLMWRQEDGRRHMEGQLGEDGKPISSWSYDQAWIDEITAQLTPEAKSVMAWIMQKYGAEHAVLNPLYRQRYGVNMPAHDNYAPITVQPVQAKAGEVIDPVSGAAMSSGSILTPGSLRTRSRNAIAEPEFRDALQTLLMHTRQLEYWKAYYDLALESSAILGNREVLNSVKAKGGEQAATALRKWIDAIAQGGFRDASASLEMNKMLQRMTGRAASVGLLGRFSTLLVQSTQLAAASVKMPIGSYLVGMSKLLTGNLGYGDAIRSPFIQRRYKSAPPIVRQAMEGLAAASRPNQIKRATRALGQLLSGTDALFTAGTYALLLDYHRGTGRALGLTGADLDEHAHTEAQRDTEQVAQPTRMAARSLAEITSTNPLAKVSWAYASEARQKIALMAWAATKVQSEPAQFAKTAFLVFGVGGLLTQVLKGLWREAKGDDDEKKWSAERLTLAALTGPLHGVPLASELMGDQGMLSGVAWAWPALKDIASGEADMRDVDTLLSTLGLFNDTAAAVASLSHAGLDAAKVIENLADKK